MKQLLAEQTKLSRVFSPGFLLNLAILGFVWICLFRMISLLETDSEIKSFDPFNILGITAQASERDIKRAYRKMSLLYHPDKNIGDAVAEQKFLLVAKAYEALTDEVSKANYEKYGNPDGRQALQLSIGLPTFLLNPSNHNVILFMYLLVLVVAIPSCVALWYSHSKKYGDSMVMYDTYGFYNYALSENSHPRMLPEILAGSAEFRDLPKRPSDEAELNALQKRFRKQEAMMKPKYNHPAIMKANVLLHAHLLREPLPAPLQSDLNSMLKRISHFVDGMLEISVMKSWLQTTLNLIELQQYLTQALWLKDSPFLQLPHFTEAEVKHVFSGKKAVRSMHQYLDLKPEERKGMSNFTEEQRKEADRVCDQLPSPEVKVTLGVEDEQEIAEGDIMTVTVELTRKNVKENETCDLVYAPRFPYPKAERWYCVVGDAKLDHLHAFDKLTAQDRVCTMKLQLPAPATAGSYQLEVFVKCDSYIGLDLRAVVKFPVVSASTLPVYEPHPEDLELDNEPTLFEQVMNGAESSDSEGEEGASGAKKDQ
ncbi:unnamed protein product [Albugo candida]|nr:unnamed protein product [Albugo candida]|eukprot:CCI50662.1 unnamed protein product [Albugo candida]